MTDAVNILPIQPTPLIGRDQEMTDAAHLLQRQEVRLLTLTGVGGSGKTRLGIQLAAELRDHFPDGVFFVALAPVRDPSLVALAIVQALRLKNTDHEYPLSHLQAYLRDKRFLLVLDNFEHVAPAAPLLAELLETCPHLNILVTSRELLHLRAEYQFPVLPLTLPNLKDLSDLASLSRFPAVELFVQRAQAILPGFHFTRENARPIAEICVRLDGLPLAIELAAARINLLSPRVLLTRLDRRLQVLTSTMRDVPERQQTLRKTLDWSYNLLTPQEQCLFRRLSIFVGGWSLDAAEMVCKAGHHLEMELLDGMTSLLEKNLVQQRSMQNDELRLMMLETLREYGLERLAEAGETDMVRRAHAKYFLAVAEEAELAFHSPQQVRWMERLEREHDNLREVLRWSLELEGREMPLRLGGALWWFWNLHGHLGEGSRFLARALAGSDNVAASVRARALRTAGGLGYIQADFERAESLCHQGLVLFRELGDVHNIGDTLWMLGQIAWVQGRYSTARELVEEARKILTAAGDRQVIIYVLIMLARVEIAQGNATSAQSLLQESLTLARERYDTFHTANALSHLAQVAFFFQGDTTTARSRYEEALNLNKAVGVTWRGYDLAELSQIVLHQGDAALARSLLEEGLEIAREVGDRRGLARGLFYSANITAFQGDDVAASPQYEEGLKRLIQIGDAQFIAMCLERLGQVASRQGEPVWAARFWGAAEVLREVMGSPQRPVERPLYEQAVAEALTCLGEKRFAAAWSEGRALTPEQALARREPVPLSQKPSSPALPVPETSQSGLTKREREVLRLLASGLTNAQIAEQLTVSQTTISTHVASIFSKLGVTTRSAATRYAIEHHLV